MKASRDVHPIQAQILKALQLVPQARFSELNSQKISTDQFNFHLKSLLEADIIKKQSNLYTLTTKGKEFANRFNTEKLVIEKQAKLTLKVCPIKMVKGKKYYLLHQRLKQPYYGLIGNIGGKIQWGETVLEAAARELQEETRLVAKKMTLLGVLHKYDFFDGDKEPIEDKYFFIVRVDKFSGELNEKIPEGKNMWMTKDEILKDPNMFKATVDFLDVFDQDEFQFFEKKYLAEKY